MNKSSRPVSRTQKIVNRVLPFFDELARQLHDPHTRRPDRAEEKPDRPKLRLIQGGHDCEEDQAGFELTHG